VLAILQRVLEIRFNEAVDAGRDHRVAHLHIECQRPAEEHGFIGDLAGNLVMDIHVLQLALHGRLALRDEVDLVAVLGMAQVVILQRNHVGVDLALDRVRQAVGEDDHDVDIRALDHLARHKMLTRFVMSEKIGKVARNERAHGRADFARQVEEKRLHHLLGQRDLLAADLAVHVGQGSLALDHLVTLARQAEQRE